MVRSDSAVRLVRRSVAPPEPMAWGADVGALFAAAESARPSLDWRPWQVLGGPGTGKTSLLVDLAARRIEAGADPESMLLLTHSKQAAASVRDAITARTGHVFAGATRDPLVRTVHSYAFAVLRRHAGAHGNPAPRLLTGSEQDAVLREMLRGDRIDVEAGVQGLWPQRLWPALEVGGFAEQLRDLMLRATERGIGPEDLVRLGREHDRPEWVAAGRFATRYEQTMLLRWSVGVEAPEATAPALDAAELVGATLDAFAADAELLAAERARLRWLLVDDAQHLDPQAAMLVRAVGRGADLAVVAGDPDQSVFAFRGADARFAADPGASARRRIILRHNHRSAAAIETAVARVAARLPGSSPQRPVLSDRSPDPEASAEVLVRVLATPAKEAAMIADHLRRAHLTEGVPWSRMAVIVRSVPLSLPPLRRALHAAGVPVQQPALATPLARRRGAEWMLLSLRALLAGERAGAEHLFTAEQALDLLSGPLGGADQISLRRLRRGIRRSVLAAQRSRGVDAAVSDVPVETDSAVTEQDSIADAWSTTEQELAAADFALAASGQRDRDDGDWYGLDDAAYPDAAEPVDVELIAESDVWESDSSEMPASSVSDRQWVSESDPAEQLPRETATRRTTDVDRPSAEILRDLLVGVGDRSLLSRLTEVEAAPLRRVAAALDRARAARRKGAGLEDVLWSLWTAARLQRRWVAQSERGGPVGMQADRDLDAAVGVFDAAAAYVDRLPRASVAGFVEYLSQQQIPFDSGARAVRGDGVALLSAHAAAGREWDVVAIAAVQEGIWPDPRSRGTLLRTEDLIDLAAGIAEPGERVSRSAPVLAEERRLLLVACSRARRSLLVTAVESVAGERDLVPSRFLAELLGGAEADVETATPAIVDPGRALALHALVAELRGVVCDVAADPRRRQRAARQLARLADAGVPGTDPDSWYGTGELSSLRPLWDDENGAVGLSPSTVELLRTCPLRWALERHGGTDGDNPHAVKGNVVHTLVQALAGQVPEPQVRAALARAWRAIDPEDGWHSRQELRRTEAMLETFLDWVRRTRSELTQAGVEVPIDCELPARSEAERPVRIRGRVDRLERDALGRFVIVDVKTGKTPVSKQAAMDHAQLATYQVAAAAGALGDPGGEANDAVSPGDPGGARLVYVAKPNKQDGATQRLQPALDTEALQQWRNTIHEAAAATKGPDYTAVRNEGCRHCPVAGSCPVQDTGRQVTDE